MNEGTGNSKIFEGGIIEFLRKKGKGNFIIRSMNWWGPFRFRTRAFAALFHGIFSIKEFPLLILPTAKRPWDLDQRFALYINSETQKAISLFIKSDGSVDVLGKSFFAPLKNYYEMVSLLNEIIVCDQYHATELLKKDAVVIDAGANIGTFSTFAAGLAEEGHIYSFEPSKKTFEVLVKNTQSYKNVTCVPMGLGDVKVKKDILVHEVITGGNVFVDSPLASEYQRINKVHVENALITTIDDFIAEKKIPRVDFIKIDTEGYEERILKGAAETIRRWRPIIAMSAYHNPSDKDNLPALLMSISPNYICTLYKEGEEDFICQPAL